MSEGNLLDQHHHRQHQQTSKLFSSRDSELELLDTTTPTTSSPEIRSRSQSVGSAHQEALLFFEQHRLFQNSPDLGLSKKAESYDCELRSISSCSRTSSPVNRFIDQAVTRRTFYTGNDGLSQQCRQQATNLRHQQQVPPASSLRQHSDSNLLESSTAANASSQPGSARLDATCVSSSPGRARSQSQGQCGSVRRKHTESSSRASVTVVNTTNKKQGGTSSVSDATVKGSKWLKEIQFTAQYQHYRTNNYASVVSSASSLDKSDGGTSSLPAVAFTAATGEGNQQNVKPGVLSAQSRNKQKDAPEAESRSRSSTKQASSSSSQQHFHKQRHRHHSHQLTKSYNNQEREEGATEEFQLQHNLQQYTNPNDLNRQNSITASQCWNFPRVKLKKLFTAKSLDDILGGRSSRTRGRKSLQVASSSDAQDETCESYQRSSSSPEIVLKTTHTKKAQLLRDNKLSLLRTRHDDDTTHLLIVKPAVDGSKSPGAHSSKSAIVISSTSSVAEKQRKVPSFIKATRQKSRSFSALTSVLLSRVPGHSSSANSPCSSTASTATGGSLSVFFTKRSHQQDKNAPPVVPPKKPGRVPCAKSDNCLNRFVASATCVKFVDYFAETSARASKSAASTVTLVEPFGHHEHYPLGTPSSSSTTGHTSTSAVAVVTAQPRKWTAIKNKWDQKLQASGDRQKEIGASLASVSNNAQIFRKAHHQHQQRQRSSSLSPLDNPDNEKSIDSLLEITSPSPTLQEVRFLDTPEIRYASPIAVRSSCGHYIPYDNDDDDDNNEDDSETLIEGANNSIKVSRETIATACSSDTESYCSECKEVDEVSEMTRHHHSGATGGGGGTKRSRDHHHRHSRHHHSSASKEKPKLVVANVSYLQRPMSPGLVLREASPSSSATGTIDPFGNLVSCGSVDTGGYLSSSVIRNNNVFTSNSNNNQQYQHSKTQQAKLEFLKASPISQTQFHKRDPLCANTSIVNVNENRSSGVGFSGAFSMSISPSSSGGASEKDNNGGNNSGIGASTTGNLHETIMSPHQLDDLQNPFNRRRATQFADANLRSATGDPLITKGNTGIAGGSASGGGIKGCGVVSSVALNKTTKGVSQKNGGARVDDDSTNLRKCQSPPYNNGAEHCGLGDQSAIGFTDHHYEGAISGNDRVLHASTTSDYGSRSTDSQSGERDPDTNSKSGKSSALASGDTLTSFSINQVGDSTTLAQSTANNNLFIDVDFDGTEDTMGDLQSPQYVKRTAHMFDSQFSSDLGANGHERNVRNPSYLNVSRSVSGYSCLTYNNGVVTSETVSNKTSVGNGTSLLSGTRVTPAATRLKTDFALQSSFSRKAHHTDEDSDHSSSQSTTSPPPSLPPINTSSTGRYAAENSFFQNGMNRGDNLLDDTPYIPSHGKSFIMQRIERLYGSDAVSNKGVLTRKSSNVTTISISRESSPLGKEMIIPIKVEPRDDHQNNLYNSGVLSSKHEISTEERPLIGVMAASGGAGLVLQGINGAEGNGYRIQHRRSRGSFDDTDDDEDGIRTGSYTNPMKLHPTTAVDNSGHLNGNANHYGNGVAVGPRPYVKRTYSVEARIPKSAAATTSDIATEENTKLEQNIHTNGNYHEQGVEGQDCTVMRKALSRESSAESDETNDCSENSLEFGVSPEESKKSVSRQDSRDNSLYSNRGSPLKPKPKPKPKDMALLRTLSRSPALKTGPEILDKTAISLSIVQPEVVNVEDTCSVEEDQTDAGNTLALSDIKNTVSLIAKGKLTADKDNHVSTDKENTHVSVEVHKIQQSNEIKDGNYFLNEMDKVKHHILKLSEDPAKELETLDPSEDRAGSIHAAIGKGNLLVKKKFKQFAELCNANLKGATGDEPETTNEDLAGFWDMVMIQVDQIYALFADLENKVQDTYTVISLPSKTASPKRTVGSTTKSSPRTSVGVTPKANNAAAKARDEARRKMIAEKRKAMKSQMLETQEAVAEGQESEVQIFSPDTPQTG